MPVRPQSLHDGVVERRLRPIYDWLDNGNNKKALHEAEKVLKKTPTLQSARALKALSLFRLGRTAEAHIILNALADEKPSDDTTLQAMTISYRESQQLNKVCELYETAVKADPKSEELHSHLFMSHVRVGDYKSQQRAAMALYKFAPKNPYYFWAVMSIVMQAQSSHAPTKGILLSLAQRMVDNFISENKMEAEQEARLYIMILELQDKWEDILKFIESPLYKNIVPGPSGYTCIPYLKQLGQWKKLNILCKELLWDNQDRWDYYMPYFDSVFQLMKNKDENKDDQSVDDSPEKCHEFICQIVESMSSGKTLRGPYLARLELWKRLSDDGDPTALIGSGMALLVQYLKVFAHKPCAVPDIKPYLAMIPQKEREKHCRDFLSCFDLNENSEPDQQDDIQRHVSCLSAFHLTSPDISASASLQLAKRLRQHYLRCLKNSLVTSTVTEFCAADSYGHLAAHYYFNAAIAEQNATPIYTALSVLELVLHNSPANFHIKLLLVQFYHIIGNAKAAKSIYERLEIKHIQNVSLAWLHTCRMASSAPAKALRPLALTHATIKHHQTDSMEHLTYAYKYGTFEKVCPLAAWAKRLAMCGWAARAARDHFTLALLTSSTPTLDCQPLLEEYTDNRDLNIILDFESPEKKDNNYKSRSFEQDLAYLRIKDHLVTCVTQCTELNDRQQLDEKKLHCDKLKLVLEKYKNEIDIGKEKYSSKEKISISKPFPSRIIGFLNSPVPYRELYTLLFKMVADFFVGRLAESFKQCQSLCGHIDRSLEKLELNCQRIGIWGLREDLESLADYLEFIGVVSYLIRHCNDSTATNANSKKSKKKTNQSPEELQSAELLNNLNVSIQNAINKLMDIFESLPNYELSDDFACDFASLTLDEKYKCPVKQKLVDGHQELVTDIKTILDNKLKLLKGMQTI